MTTWIIILLLLWIGRNTWRSARAAQHLGNPPVWRWAWWRIDDYIFRLRKRQGGSQ